MWAAIMLLSPLLAAHVGETSIVWRRARTAPGDSFTFFSDGVVEAQSPSGELFGFERSRAIASQSARSTAEMAQRFGQEDDITVVTLKSVPAQALQPQGLSRTVQHGEV